MAGHADEIHQLAVDIGKIPHAMSKKVQPIMFKTGMVMKKVMVADVKKSHHFRGKRAPGLDASIDFDVKFSAGHWEMEVGPNADRAPAAALAGIAYFGGSNGGGGTVTDPTVRMREEAPKFFGFMEELTEGLL